MENKKRIYNLIILDESGSMQSIKKEAIDSVNETIQTIRCVQQQNDNQEQFVLFVTFHNEVRILHDCVPCEKVQELTGYDYMPQCCTALYDAMGISLTALRNKVVAGDRVLVTVVTDGYENASREYSGVAIKNLVDELKAEGWVFAYIGANHDVESVAATISITNVMKFETTSKGVKCMSMKANKSREKMYYDMVKDDFCASKANINFFVDTCSEEESDQTEF